MKTYISQELVQDGDLIEYKNNDYSLGKIKQVGLINGILCVPIQQFPDGDISYVSIIYVNITKILTPNANGGFDLQWSDKE